MVTTKRRGETSAAAGLCLMLLILSAGCRQPEGTVPVPVDEQPNKISDMSHDLQFLANGDAQAETYLTDDLMNLDGAERPDLRVRELTRSLAAKLPRRPLSDAAALALAHELFIASTGRELSVRQIGELGSRVREIVGGLGAAEDDAARVAAAATALASEVTENPHRWYHR